jgi:hypothetical protein
MIDGQTSDIRALKSSNVKLTSSNAELISSNVELIFSNANLLEKVHNLEASKNDISSTLQSESLGFWLDDATRSILSSRQHSRRIHALKRRLVLDDARINLKLSNGYNLSLDEIRPRLVQQGSVQRMRGCSPMML